MRRKNFLIALAFAAVTALTLRFTIGPRHWGHHCTEQAEAVGP